MEIDTAFMLFCLYVCRTEIQIILLLFNREKASCSHSQGSEINSQTQSFDAYRNSFLRVILVIIEIINYPFKLGKMRFNRLTRKKTQATPLVCMVFKPDAFPLSNFGTRQQTILNYVT
jgi:hypothetical protein